MEMHPGSENGPTETYMIPVTGPNSQQSLLSNLEEIGYMANEVASEVIYDQGLYYPPANYYGYFSTGVEQQSEWNDQHMFLGVDGQEVLYSGLQPESYPYVYYSPTYGYAQSSYNPYNPYIPGAVVGADSSVIGSHQYLSDPSYQLPAPSPTTYLPTVVQRSSDAVPNSSSPSLSGRGTSHPNRQASTGSKPSQALMSSNGGSTSQGTASKKSSSVITSGSNIQMNQNKTSSGLNQATDQFSYGNFPYVQSTSMMPSNSLPPNYGTGVRGWGTTDQFRPRPQFNGKNGNQNPNILGEQNRGPRTNKAKGQWSPAISPQMSEAGGDHDHKAIIIRADQYNKDDFPLDYPEAKFFVIKSYSEDDVHKSIKYNVWSSTPNGNKRLNAAYEDELRISAGKLISCPVFLFFSVNASGQFCGVAEMIGPVDFHKDMDFWQQDKWTGSFPVKWHIVKDVPNTSFRHILLENNENKPVTNSRDTQEVPHVHGINMLTIFKSSPLKTSILDDFMFYEERQKIIQEQKSRFMGKSNMYLPAVISARKPIEPVEHNESADHSSKDIEQSSFISDQSPKSDGKQVSVRVHLAADVILANHEDEERKHIASELSDDKKDVNIDQIGDDDVATSNIKMNLLSVGSKEGNSEPVAAKTNTETNVVTVGSMPIEVNGTAEPSATDI